MNKLVLAFSCAFFTTVSLAGQAQQFGPLVSYPVGQVGVNPRQILTADFTGDGYADLATGNFVTHEVAILRNQGDGTFAPAVTYPLCSDCTPYGLAAGDVDGDGHSDLVTANYSTPFVSVVRNKGDGTFAISQEYPLANNISQGQDIALADVNGDGALDILLTTLGTPTLSVLLNQGRGQFGPCQAYSYALTAVIAHLTVADFDRDGRPDVAITHFTNFTSSTGHWVSVFYNQGNGQFRLPTDYALAANTAPFGITAADLNADGYPDLLTANSGTDDVGVLLNDGTGSFVKPRYVSTGLASQPLRVVVAPLAENGQPALVTASYGFNGVGIVPQLAGSGSDFGSVITVAVEPAGQPSSVVVADFDHNGRLDVATCNSAKGSVTVRLNQLPLAAAEPTLAAVAGAYPNPVRAGTPLQVLLPAGLEAALVDLLGRHVWQGLGPVSAGPLRVPTQSLAPGCYYLQLSRPTTGWLATQKVIVY
ncbi:MAG: FG-GAP repeat domain-containing protein [Janthinobacterium lividum]